MDLKHATFLAPQNLKNAKPHHEVRGGRDDAREEQGCWEKYGNKMRQGNNENSYRSRERVQP